MASPGRAHLFPPLLALLVLLIGAFEPATLWLRYDRDAIRAGEVWRLISGSFVHLGWPHLLMNLAGLLLVWAIFARVMTPGRWLLLTVAGALGVGLGLLAFNPAVHWYVGLSGVLHTLLAAGVLLAVQSGERIQWLLAILLIIKLSWEQLYGPLPGSDATAGGPVLVDAHLWGAVTGVVLGLLLIRPRRR